MRLKIKSDNIIERIDYVDERDELDRYLHIRRYELAWEYCKKNNILDLGCGLGWGTNFLSSKGLVIGIDIDGDIVRKAKERYKSNKNVIFIIADVTNLPFKNGSFDNVVSMENIEHVKEQKKYLKNVYNVLREHGIIVLSTPNTKSISNRIARIVGVKLQMNPYHIHEFDSQELKKCLTENKFTILLFRGVYFPLMPGIPILKKIRNKFGIYKFLIELNSAEFDKYIFVVGRKK